MKICRDGVRTLWGFLFDFSFLRRQGHLLRMKGAGRGVRGLRMEKGYLKWESKLSRETQ